MYELVEEKSIQVAFFTILTNKVIYFTFYFYLFFKNWQEKRFVSFYTLMFDGYLKCVSFKAYVCEVSMAMKITKVKLGSLRQYTYKLEVM